MQDLPLIISLISLGFFGGFSHCIGMCGPFVLTQVNNRLQQTSLENFSEFKKLRNLALLPYHLGRITSYSIIGFFCSFLTQNLQNFIGFKIFSAFFLIIAAIIFLNLFLEKNILTSLKLTPKIKGKIGGKIKLPFKSKILKSLTSFFSDKISVLFLNPHGLKGYFLGIILGFIPCGLLYAAFLIAGSIENPIFAAIGIMFFGISTFPSLFLTACGGKILAKMPEFKLIAKTVILLNIITLFFMAVKLIS